MVILTHYFKNIVLFSFGWSGVDLFFVLSGFLISSRIIPFVSIKYTLSKFYINRALRILPLYYGFLTIFFTTWFVLVSLNYFELYTFYAHNWWTFFLFFQNWAYIIDLLKDNTADFFIMHFWSLAVEEQFYLVFPLFVLALKKTQKIFVCSIVLVIFIVLSRSTYFFYNTSVTKYAVTFWNTFFRLDSFFIGVILYCIIKLRKNTFLFLQVFKIVFVLLSFVLCAVFYLNNGGAIMNIFFPTVGYSIVAVLYSFVLYYSLFPKKAIWKRVINNNWLVFIGKISFGLYILHVPVFFLCEILLNRVPLDFYSQNSLKIIFLGLTSFTITFLISVFSFKYFESYFLRKKIKIVV